MSDVIERDIKRILVALDPCRQNPKALERALLLAERMQAELTALFVEDENLLRLAELPFAREVHRSSATERKLDATQINRLLQRQTESLRRLLERSAGQRNIRATLRVVQGRFMPVALSAALDSDVAFLTVADQSYSPASTDKLSRRAAQTPVKPVWTVFDGSAQSIRTLALAAELSAPETIDLMLLLPAADPARAGALQEQVTRLLAQMNAQTQFRCVNVDETELAQQLARMIRRQGCSLLVLHRDDARLADIDNAQVLGQLGCPIVLVR